MLVRNRQLAPSHVVPVTPQRITVDSRRDDAINCWRLSVSELPFYPAAISTALFVAGIVSYFTRIPYVSVAILLLAGAGVAGLVSYRADRSVTSPPAQARTFLQRRIARLFRVAVGASIIGLVTVVALRSIGDTLGAA